MSPGIPKNPIQVRRIYEPAMRGDGLRILVEKLWPRGLAKSQVHIDRWVKDLAPSSDLRKWFNHRADRWIEFQSRYADELRPRKAQVGEMRRLARRRRITLLFSARDEEHNNAIALRKFLVRGIPRA